KLLYVILGFLERRWPFPWPRNAHPRLHSVSFIIVKVFVQCEILRMVNGGKSIPFQWPQCTRLQSLRHLFTNSIWIVWVIGLDGCLCWHRAFGFAKNARCFLFRHCSLTSQS